MVASSTGWFGPRGDRHQGYWEILEAEAPHRLVFGDGVAGFARYWPYQVWEDAPGGAIPEGLQRS